MRYLLTLAIFAVAAGASFAQTPEVVAEVESLLKQERQAVDVEVLRRLLNQKFGFADKSEIRAESVSPSWNRPGSTASLNFDPFNRSVANLPANGASVHLIPNGGTIGEPRLSQLIGPFDGSVLPGGGIVYTLRIPAGSELKVNPKTNAIGLTGSCQNCHRDVSMEAPNHPFSHRGIATTMKCNACHEGGTISNEVKDVGPKSDWERTKLQVAVEKIGEAGQPQPKPKTERAEVCQPGDIAEAIVQVLAANAKNLGQWGELPSQQLNKSDRITVIITFDELPSGGTSILAPSSKLGFTPDELQSLNLAGLHLKQQKYKEAAEAFEKGLARYHETLLTVNLPANTRLEEFTKAAGESAESIRDMHKQLATAYVNLGELKKANRSIDIAMNLKFEILTAKTSEKPKPKIPAKIVVSITKAEIDTAKSGEDFRKAVSIQRQGFPALKK